ncbi:FK506-binding protein 5-like protein [Lates japonicus]|uniref:FK506-binding protein 5-like protein n=1 Tax=Lates japonicus TaxID=270547 RepID=A0AAD3R982_LATJO|nr:FK506-binding protein 5-like protein [Lates japonicus]
MKRRMSPWGASSGSGPSSDSAAMASGPPDVMANQEPAEVQEQCSGKKKSKFQTFKKLFARKKRKEPSGAGADAGLKASQSSDNVSKTSENNTLTRSEKDKGSGSKISLGSKALSHDSVFVSDSSEANEALGASQDSIHGKVKSLQLQLKQAIRLGSPPSLMCVKRTDDAGTMSEDDGLPCSPPEYTTLHTVMNQAQRNSSISLEGVDSDDDQLSCAASSRAMSPLVVPGDFSQPASPFACLDNSAAKHKLGLRHKACNKRKPASRLELKTEGDSVVDEMLNTSVTEALVEQEQKTEVVSFDELQPKVEREEEEEEEEEQEKEQPQQSRQSLLRDEEEREEGEDESETEQDVSHSPDTSSPPELSLSEEEAPDALPSSKPSSRASSLDSPRATPEPPAGPKEYLLDPPGISYGAEESSVERELVLRAEDDEVQENQEEESSFLQEVLSSLKTPLASCPLGVETEGIVLEMEEEIKEKEKEEEEEIEDEEEVKEEEAEEVEPVSYEAAPSGLLVLGHTTEEEDKVSTPPCQTEVIPIEEEAKDEEGEAAAEEEEELAVEQFDHGQEEEEEAENEEAEEVKPEEENDMLTRKTDITAEEERQEEESEGEEEAMELEKEPVVEDEGWEKREEGDEEVEEMSGNMDEAEEANEDREDVEEMTETFPEAAEEEEVGVAMSLQEADESVDAVGGDKTVCTAKHTSDDEIPAELGEVQEGQEIVEENVEIDQSEQKSDHEEDVEMNQPDVDETEQENLEISYTDTKQVEKDQTEAAEQATVASRLPSLSLPESRQETQSRESGTISPSKTSTIHINLVSPSSEKVTSFFQQSPTAAEKKENVTESPSHAEAATEQHAASTDEQQADSVEEVEEEKQPALEEQTAPPASVQEAVNQPSSSSDQSKVRFTIAPAWQRSQSLTPPSSPLASVSSLSSAITGPGGEEVEATIKKDPAVKAEPASSPKVELVLSPGRARSAGSTAKPQSNATPSPSSVKPQTSAAASTEESSVVVEGNPDNPFGVRLRKTSGLHRFSSEEENTESQLQLISGGSGSPNPEYSVKQKQKIYKENSLDEITVKRRNKRESLLPMYVSSAASSPNRAAKQPVHQQRSKHTHMQDTSPNLKCSDSHLLLSHENHSRKSLVQELRAFWTDPPPARPASSYSAQGEPPWIALAKKKAKAWARCTPDRPVATPGLSSSCAGPKPKGDL